MNPSSKPNKTSTDPVEATAQTRKKTKALKSASAPKAIQTAKKPAQSTPQVKAKPKALDKKPKLVHDSYSLPKDEAAALGVLKRRVAALGLPVKKNHLLRAGLLTLSQLGDATLLDALRALPEPSRADASSATPKPAKTKAVKTKTIKPGQSTEQAKAGKAKKAAKASKASKPAQAQQTAQPTPEAQA